MLVIDASKSAQNYLVDLSEVLRTFFDKFMDPAAKVGMIAIQDGHAKMLFAPTRNRLRVFGRMKELKSGGYTPLATALQIARMQLLQLKRADPVNRSFIILVSDCYPEPIQQLGDPYEAEPYKEVRHQAELLRQSGIPSVVIDPSNPSKGIAEKLPGRRLARFITNVSRGVYINIPMITLKSLGSITPKFVEDEETKQHAQKILKELMPLLVVRRIEG